MLVSVAELAKYMDIKFTQRQSDAAEMVLSGLQSELESFLRRPIQVDRYVESHIIEVPGAGVPTESIFYTPYFDTAGVGTTTTYATPPITVYLRNSPVVEVESVVIYRPASVGASFALTPDADYTVRRFGIDCYRASPNDRVVVTYTGGLHGESIPVFRVMILRAASREMQNMHDDVVGVKDLEPRNVGPAITGFTADELAVLKGRWKRTRVN